MRMRQSLAEWEAAFHEEIVEEQSRRERLRQEAVARSRARRQERVHKQGTLRFVGLVTAILATSILVTVVMFEALARLIGS